MATISKPFVGQRPDPERVYEQLLRHAQRCPSCRPWLDQLYKVQRLCPVGKTVVELYARSVAMATETTGSSPIGSNPSEQEVSLR